MKLLYGVDVLDGLKTLPDESVHCCVTSPPYWGLRDYREDGQIGLEKTPEEFVSKMVSVFQEVRRVLRKDGSVWINLGDTYNNVSPGSRNSKRWPKQSRNDHKVKKPRFTGLKKKDLCGIPWMVAFALRSDGWYLRQDIIWHKPNPMPESVNDRCTKSHEYVFLLSKSSKYFFDSEAIKEKAQLSQKESEKKSPSGWDSGEGDHRALKGRYQASGKWSKEAKQSSGKRITDRVAAARASGADHDSPFSGMRNKRSVWTVTTKGYPGAHFATFPQDLIIPMIQAGCPRGGTVLDPFSGSGTTGEVALNLGRDYIGIDINKDYERLARERFGLFV